MPATRKLGDTFRIPYFKEMLTDERIRELPLYEDAITMCSQLEVLLPEETDTPAASTKLKKQGTNSELI